MTKAQLVRRHFKSGLPRRIENRVLTPLEAMARTMELFDRLRSEMAGAGLKPEDVSAGLVFCQPDTPGQKQVMAQTFGLPSDSSKIGRFCDKVTALHKPLFLGVLFSQRDHETKNIEQENVIFLWPFMSSPEADRRLLAARNQVAAGGFQKIAN